MNTKPLISRRTAIKAALAAAAAVLSRAVFARATPAQTEGPFFPARDQADKDTDMTVIDGHTERALGEVIEVEGRVTDEQGEPVADALMDVWQANTHGRYAHERDRNPAPLDPNFQGWARFTTDAEGRYHFRTIVPGAYPVQPGWTRPPHIHFKVARRGYHELTTQMYFAGHELNGRDRLLLALPEGERAKLIVDFQQRGSPADDVRHGRFDIVLRRV